MQTLTPLNKVPNQFPTESGIAPYRIAIVGEAPGKEEAEQQKPFVGGSGKFLKAMLVEAGIKPEFCFIGNVCQVRPPNNDLAEHFQWDGPEIQEGIDQLRADINRFDPNLIILLGGTALRAAKGQDYVKQKTKWIHKNFSIGDWRGSVFLCDKVDSPFYGRKCLATLHPAYLMRVYSDIPLVRFDLKRARKHGTFKELPDSGQVFDVSPDFETIIARLRIIREHKIAITLDIEGGVSQGVSCLSISATPKEAFIIPFCNKAGYPYWTEEQEEAILIELDLVLGDVDIKKTLQNAMYDAFVLAYVLKILIRNIKDDTMIKHWELYCELEKNLGLLTSLYTEHPYYKGDIGSNDILTFWRYCCQDSANTNEINEVETKLLGNGPSNCHYRFNMDIVPAFLYIELRGMRLDMKKRSNRIIELTEKCEPMQAELEGLVGWDVNVMSNKQMQKLLYEDLKLPLRFKERKKGVKTITADYETLLGFAMEANSNPILHKCIKVRQLRKRLSDIESLTPDPDGRIRSSTNIVGANTGRTTNSKAPTGEGTNLQTVTGDDRDLLIADEDHDFAQCDLAGADGWTVAAHCARLGDPTMLEDYLYGLKPAKIIALMKVHGPEVVATWDRATIKRMGKDINADTDPENGYIYFTCKRCQHGTNYMMECKTLAKQIFLDSEGLIIVTPREAARIQEYYLMRYKGVPRWHEWLEKELKTKGYLICASGHRRLFFGRKDAHDTLKQACAEEPQHNTTYGTNLALRKLWYSERNRLPSGRLQVWPCHQVHDALCTQWHVSQRDFGMEMMHDAFNNELIIAGMKIRIPFEGRYGRDWQLKQADAISF